MKPKNLSTVLEFIGAVGVIASIIFLAIQVRISTKVAKAEISKDMFLASREAIMNLASDENLGKIWTEIGEFESEEAARKWSFYQSFFRLYELEYSLEKQDLVNESLTESYVLVIKMFGNTKDFKPYWQRAKSTYNKEFADYVDELISQE